MDVKRKRLLLVAVIVALFIAGCGAQKSGSDTAGASLSVASVRGIDNEGRGLEIGQLAPDFEMQYPDGRKVKLSDFKGKPVIVNFWATWCAPCEAELPEFVQTYEKYKDQGLVILGVNAQESGEDANKFVEKYGLSFPVRQEDLKRQRLEEELSLGRQIQLSMLPKASPTIPGWNFVAVYEAARVVGGDFYDYFELPGKPRRLGMVIADVADKGVPAALFMALSRTIIRTVAFSGRGAAAALTRANQLILNDSESDLFLSACYGILEVDSGRLLLANAGHNRPLWYHAETQCVQEIKTRGIILGVFEPIQIDERRITVLPDDVILFYTDGVTEALSRTTKAAEISVVQHG